MQARFVGQYLHAAAEMARQGLLEQVGFAAVETAQLLYVAPQVSLTDERGQGELLNGARRLVVQAADAPVVRQESRRQHHVADAQAGEEEPRKGPQIDDVLSVSHALQGRDGRRKVAEFAVVIVLEDIAVPLQGPAQEAAPQVRGQGASLVRVGGAHVQEPRLHRVQGFRIKPGDVPSLPAENLFALGKARPFPGNLRRSVEQTVLQEGRQDDEQALHTGADDDLVRRADDAPGPVAVVCQGFAQGRFPLGLAVSCQGGLFLERLTDMAAPDNGRERRPVDVVVGKIIARGRPRAAGRQFPRQLFRHLQVRHEIPALGFADQVSFGRQPAVTGFRRRAAQVQRRGQVAHGRKAHARRHQAEADLLLDEVRNLQVERFFPGPVRLEVGQQHGILPFNSQRRKTGFPPSKRSMRVRAVTSYPS